MTKSVLLVIAHPDDECMFFTPSIRNYAAEGVQVDLLCLSTGNFDGKGKIRRRELEESVKVLGISSLHIIDDKDLQDGQNNQWKAEVIYEHVKRLTDKKRYAELVTFDDGGVSGHLNHCSISEALRVYGVKAWRLQTLPLLLKYSGFLGSILCKILFTSTKSRKVYSLSLREAYKYGFCAMLKHESQLAWFRRLYLIFSIYMTMNILTRE